VGWAIEKSWFDSREGQGSHFLKAPKPAVEPTYPRTQCVSENIFPRIKRARRKSNYLPHLVSILRRSRER